MHTGRLSQARGPRKKFYQALPASFVGKFLAQAANTQFVIYFVLIIQIFWIFISF